MPSAFAVLVLDRSASRMKNLRFAYEYGPRTVNNGGVSAQRFGSPGKLSTYVYRFRLPRLDGLRLLRLFGRSESRLRSASARSLLSERRANSSSWLS